MSYFVIPSFLNNQCFRLSHRRSPRSQQPFKEIFRLSTTTSPTSLFPENWSPITPVENSYLAFSRDDSIIEVLPALLQIPPPPPATLKINFPHEIWLIQACPEKVSLASTSSDSSQYDTREFLPQISTHRVPWPEKPCLSSMKALSRFS